MALTLLRHTTPDVVKGTCYGRTDLALADSFETELEQVLAQVPHAQLVVTSPLGRCHRLAERLSRHLSVKLYPVRHWIEMDFGTWEGVPWSGVPRAGLDAWAADFKGYAGHGGESVAMLEARVRHALEVTPDHTIVVTHSGCIRAACAILGLHRGWDTDTPFGGVVRLR